MKIRLGYVSNSSASSFTIYGWTETDLSEHVGKLLPSFAGVSIQIDEDLFCENIEKLWDGHERDIITSRDADGYNVIGLGQAGDEIDHCQSLTDGRWEDFEFPEPNEEQKKKFDKLAKKMKLPKPKIYKGTFFA